MDTLQDALIEIELLEKTINQTSAILNDVANILKGDPKPGHMHSVHDLAQWARDVVEERDELRSAAYSASFR
jgi:hypothetical protein